MPRASKTSRGSFAKEEKGGGALSFAITDAPHACLCERAARRVVIVLVPRPHWDERRTIKPAEGHSKADKATRSSSDSATEPNKGPSGCSAPPCAFEWPA